jgi:hypothetical protein
MAAEGFRQADPGRAAESALNAVTETPFFFPSGDLRLEGALERGSKAKGVVITHPHLLYFLCFLRR